jgi:hypothetical protein
MIVRVHYPKTGVLDLTPPVPTETANPRNLRAPSILSLMRPHRLCPYFPPHLSPPRGPLRPLRPPCKLLPAHSPRGARQPHRARPRAGDAALRTDVHVERGSALR